MEHRRGGRPRHPGVLTPAEWRVLDELREGGTNAEIAARLGIGAETVKSHVSSMLAKLGLRSREELAAWRPEERRGRLPAWFAVPAALGSFARPLVWVGAGVATLAGVVAVVVALVVLEVALEGNSGPPPVTPPAAPRSPTPTQEEQPSAAPVASPTPPAPDPTPSPAPSLTATPPPTPSPSQSTSPAPEPGRCASPTDADCIIAVYEGAPGDYDQVGDVPAEKLLGRTSDGRYHVERGQQYTVVTAAQLPSTGGWTRFYLQRSPTATPQVPSPVSASRSIEPIGTTYTFTVTAKPSKLGTDHHATVYTYRTPAQFSYHLKAAKPFGSPRPDGKPHIGDTVVTATFQVPQVTYGSFDVTGAATTAGSYGFLMPDADSDVDGATTAVTTYEQLRTDATTLVVNVTDGNDDSQAGVYGGVEDGDLVEWRETEDCWARYMVTGVATGTGAIRNIPVQPYAYTSGCSGAVSTSASVQFDWAPADIPSSALRFPVNYGDWLLVPDELVWDGELPPQVAVDLPEQPTMTGTNDHPLRNAPSVPDDWVLYSYFWGDDPVNIPAYGYVEVYRTPDDQPAVIIGGVKRARIPEYIDRAGEERYYEARVIEGYPALVTYVPDYDVGEFTRFAPSKVRLFNMDTGVLYVVVGQHKSINGHNVEDAIAIALSVMRGGE